MKISKPQNNITITPKELHARLVELEAKVMAIEHNIRTILSWSDTTIEKMNFIGQQVKKLMEKDGK